MCFVAFRDNGSVIRSSVVSYGTHRMLRNVIFPSNVVTAELDSSSSVVEAVRHYRYHGINREIFPVTAVITVITAL